MVNQIWALVIEIISNIQSSDFVALASSNSVASGER